MVSQLTKRLDGTVNKKRVNYKNTWKHMMLWACQRGREGLTYGAGLQARFMKGCHCGMRCDTLKDMHTCVRLKEWLRYVHNVLQGREP